MSKEPKVTGMEHLPEGWEIRYRGKGWAAKNVYYISVTEGFGNAIIKSDFGRQSTIGSPGNHYWELIEPHQDHDEVIKEMMKKGVKIKKGVAESDKEKFEKIKSSVGKDIANDKAKTASELARQAVEKKPNKAGILPLCSAKRKEYPIFSGLIAYFPDACAAVAHQSYLGNEKHNPGMSPQWSREKSNDHLDCIARHMMDQLDTDLDPIEEKTAAAWRALAELQLAIEEKKNNVEQ